MPARKRDSPAPWTDPDDAPELSRSWFANADLYAGTRLVRRGRGRPRGTANKVATTIRLDPQVIAFFRGSGAGWQTRINEVLAKYVARRAPGSGAPR
jgi:uncharacterized protein (DUF4415 family)